MALRPVEDGSVFEGWFVIEAKFTKKGDHAWLSLCQCVCGTIKPVYQSNLKAGLTTSCGCLKRIQSTKHGLTSKPIYAVWEAIIQRCTNPKSKAYHYYGGRGITVCDEWRDFRNFYKDMGDPPFPKASLDRVDNSKGYFKDNCAWVSQAQQNRNTRRNNMITWNGKTQCLTDWGIELGPVLGTSVDTIVSRINTYGWSIEKAFTTPVRKSGRHILRSDKT